MKLLLDAPAAPLLVAALCFVSGTGCAQDRSWYVSAGLGISEFAVDDDFRNGTRLNQATYSFDTRDVAHTLGLGRQLTRHFAVELNYADFGQVSLQGVDGNVDPLERTAAVDSRALTFDVLANVPLTGQVSAFGLVGIAHYKLDVAGRARFIGSSTPVTVPPGTDEGDALHIGAGLRLQLTDQTALSLAYTQFKAGDGNAETGIGAEDHVRTTMLKAKYHF